MAILEFDIKSHAGGKIQFEPKKLINAGYTGKDMKSIMAHIEELKEKGIAAPDSVPAFFPKSPNLLTQDEMLYTLDSSDHTGEAEFVIFFHQDKIYISVGSDHTDRIMEKVNIPKAKFIYPNVVSREAWDLSEIEDHWDDINLQCWVLVDNEKRLFQETKVSTFLSPQDLVKRVKNLLLNPDDVEGLVIFSGTVASIFQIDYSSWYLVKLTDKSSGKTISCEYGCSPISDWFSHQ